MSTAEQPDFVSAEAYLASEELATTRSEYVDGWVRAMSGATVRHNQVKINCTVFLGGFLKGKPCQAFDSDMRVRIKQHQSTRFYYPDLQVVCESNAPTDVNQDNPVLIVEVLSPSTRAYDLDEKLAAYLKISSLQCYVILEQHIPLAIVMRRTPGGFLRETYEGIDAKIELPFLDVNLPMREIYDGIEFAPARVQEPGEVYDTPA